MIKIENLTKVFRTENVETTALNGVSLEVKEGEFVAVMGPSGCGKSTLLNILGLLDNPDSGNYYLAGEEVGHLKEKDRTKYRKGRIGFVFQSFNLIDELTVEENIELQLKYLKVQKAERKQRVQEILRKVNLSQRATHYPQQLSGGQQQRVALARALAITPDVLLMDEPLSNLDAKLRIEMRTVIKGIQNDVGITTVYVTHDQEEAMAVSDRIAVMNHGDIQQIGTPKVLYQRPANLFVATFIGHTNVLDGKLKIKNGKAYLSLAGDYEVEVDTIKDDEKKDQPVKASIRPEELVVDVKGNEGLKATVDDAVFLGLNTHYFVHLVDGEKLEIIQESQIDSMIEKGTDIRLKIKTEKINIFDEAGDHNLVKGVINDYDVYKE